MAVDRISIFGSCSLQCSSWPGLIYHPSVSNDPLEQDDWTTSHMRWQIVASALAVCAIAAQVPLNPFRPAQHDVLPGASLTADSELTLSSVGTEFVEITHAAFPVSLHKLRSHYRADPSIPPLDPQGKDQGNHRLVRSGCTILFWVYQHRTRS
jgi:hypothetical protein